MARFEYTKTIEHYSFTPPSFISEEQYNQLKRQVTKHPNIPFIDEDAVEKSHGRLSVLVLAGFIGAGIGIMGMFSSDTPPGWAVILMLISVLGVLHPLINMGTYDSSRNRVRAERERIAYFRKLKELVKSYHDYNSFRVVYARVYGYR
jgi:hypothetical protein